MGDREEGWGTIMIPISIHCYGLSQVEVVGGSRQCGFDSSARWRVMCGHQTLWLYQIAHVIVETRERAFNQLWKQCVSVLLRNEECVYMCVYCVWAESMGSDSCHCCFMIPVSHTVIDPQLGFELDQREDPPRGTQELRGVHTLLHTYIL